MRALHSQPALSLAAPRVRASANFEDLTAQLRLGAAGLVARVEQLGFGGTEDLNDIERSAAGLARIAAELRQAMITGPRRAME